MDSRFFMVASLATLLAFPLQAAIYQWTDEQGRVHYSDRPVHDSAEKIKTPKTSAPSQSQTPSVDRQQRRQRMLEIYEQERAEKREAKAKAKQERKERRRQCLDARIDYENYNTAGSIYDYQENGERVYLDKQQREKLLSDLKAKMEQYCD
jgi:hypothetical protein